MIIKKKKHKMTCTVSSSTDNTSFHTKMVVSAVSTEVKEDMKRKKKTKTLDVSEVRKLV